MYKPAISINFINFLSFRGMFLNHLKEQGLEKKWIRHMHVHNATRRWCVWYLILYTKWYLILYTKWYLIHNGGSKVGLHCYMYIIRNGPSFLNEYRWSSRLEYSTVSLPVHSSRDSNCQWWKFSDSFEERTVATYVKHRRSVVSVCNGIIKKN